MCVFRTVSNYNCGIYTEQYKKDHMNTYCYVVIYWRLTMELLSLMAVMLEGPCKISYILLLIDIYAQHIYLCFK